MENNGRILRSESKREAQVFENVGIKQGSASFLIQHAEKWRMSNECRLEESHSKCIPPTL